MNEKLGVGDRVQSIIFRQSTGIIVNVDDKGNAHVLWDIGSRCWHKIDGLMEEKREEHNAMTEQPKQPTEEEFKTAKKVSEWMVASDGITESSSFFTSAVKGAIKKFYPKERKENVAMTEQPEQPTEEELLTAERVLRQIFQSPQSENMILERGRTHFLGTQRDLQTIREELYPPQSCATCRFCLEAPRDEELIYAHFCIKKDRRMVSADKFSACFNRASECGECCDAWERKQAPCQDPKKGGGEPG